MALAFEQKPTESAKAFAAFSVYLSMGAERSLAAVGRKLGKSVGLIERWSRKFDWSGRVQAHGSHMAFVEREKVDANRADISRILEVASKLGRLAAGMATDRTEVTGEDGGPIRVE